MKKTKKEKVSEMYEKLYFDNPAGNGFHYLKYIPSNIKADEKQPLLIFMHGAGERGNTDGSEVDKVAKHGYFARVAEGKEYPFVMVAPQCPSGNYWGSYIESRNKFLDFIIEENNIDTNRIYLTGLSMGGTASWLWALGNPERFAAVAPVCGEGISWYGEKLVKIPIKAFHGDIDDAVSPHASLAMVSKINKLGGKASLTLYPGVKHNAWDYAYNDELIEWFDLQSLENSEDK